MEPFYIALEERADATWYCIMQHHGGGQIRCVAKCANEEWAETIRDNLNITVQLRKTLIGLSRLED